MGKKDVSLQSIKLQILKNIHKCSTKVIKSVKYFFANPYFRILLVIDIILVSFMYIGPGNLINTHDGNYHLYRLATSISAFNDGQPLLQLDVDQISGFGQAPNLFYGPMLSWFFLILFKISNSLQVTLMFLMLLTTIITSFGTYYAANKIFKSPKAGFFTSLIFTLEPFHMGELLTRGSYSEYLAFAFVPFIILMLYQIIFEKKTDFKRVFILSFSAFGIILNHNLTTALVAGMAVLFILLNIKKIIKAPKIILSLLFSAILAICFSAVFLLPFLEVKGVGIYNIFNPDFMKFFYATGATVTPADAFLTTNMFNPPAGHASVIFGMSPVILVLVVAYVISKGKRQDKKYTTFLAVLILISLTFILFSSRVFEDISIVSKFHNLLQFSQRMLFIPAILLPFVAGYFLSKKIKDGREVMIITAAIVASYAHILAIAIEPGKHSLPMNVGLDYEKIEINVAMGEYQPIFPKNVSEKTGKDLGGVSVRHLKEVINERGKDVKVILGHAKVDHFSKRGSRMDAQISENNNGVELEFPMFYYPGFKSMINGKIIDTTYSENRRMVLVKLKPGQNGLVSVRYGVSFMSKIGFIISFLSLMSCGVYAVYKIIRIIYKKVNS